MSTSIARGAFDLVLFHYMCAIQNLLKKAGLRWMLGKNLDVIYTPCFVADSEASIA